jgi:hypothetical protein
MLSQFNVSFEFFHSSSTSLLSIESRFNQPDFFHMKDS